MSRPWQNMSQRNSARTDDSMSQFVRFCIVGAGNTLTAIAIYAIALGLGTPYLAAVPVAYFVGTSQGYLLHRRWTFRSRNVPAVSAAAARYSVVQLGGLGINLLLVFIFVRFADVPHIAAQVLAVPIVVLSTFITSRNWAFATFYRMLSRPDADEPSWV